MILPLHTNNLFYYYTPCNTKPLQKDFIRFGHAVHSCWVPLADIMDIGIFYFRPSLPSSLCFRLLQKKKDLFCIFCWWSTWNMTHWSPTETLLCALLQCVGLTLLVHTAGLLLLWEQNPEAHHSILDPVLKRYKDFSWDGTSSLMLLPRDYLPMRSWGNHGKKWFLARDFKLKHSFAIQGHFTATWEQWVLRPSEVQHHGKGRKARRNGSERGEIQKL